MKKDHDLYRFFDVDDRLLYVGISLHAAQRASSHKRDKEWWPHVARMEVEHLGQITRSRAEEIEADAIKSELPIHNVKHNRPQNEPPVLWRCEICDDVIEPGGGWLELPAHERQRYTAEMRCWHDAYPDGSNLGSWGRVDWDAVWARPRSCHWWAICRNCDPAPDGAGYHIDVERIATLQQVIEWTTHIMGKSWVTQTDWLRLLPHVTTEQPIRTSESLKKVVG